MLVLKLGAGKKVFKSILKLMNKKFGKGKLKLQMKLNLQMIWLLQKRQKETLEELQDYKEIAPQFYERMELKIKISWYLR